MPHGYNMANIKVFEVGYLQTNCYVITSDKHQGAVIVDPGGGFDSISAYIKSIGKYPEAVLLTHGHFDHIAVLSKFVSEGAKVYIHESDEEMLNGKSSLAYQMGLTLPYVAADVLLKDKDIINFSDMTFTVIHTPGHTEGSVCYLLNDSFLFSGDTLFLESYGRTDFVNGSMEQMRNSLKQKLFTMQKDYTVYPGHGEATTLFYEKKNNPIWVD